MIKNLFKVAVAAFLIWLFVIPTVTGFNDSYEEKFCKHYGQWNKYAWSVTHQNSENWQNLEQDEYSKMMDIVYNDSPSEDNLITKVANQWFADSAAGDYQSGKTMAALLIVECEKYGVKVDEKYLE